MIKHANKLSYSSKLSKSLFLLYYLNFISVLYEAFNVYGSEAFTHDEIFRLYKVLLGHVVNDDFILALTDTALNNPSLRTKGEITREEFMRVRKNRSYLPVLLWW